MTVVGSIRAADIGPADRPGVRLLRHYPDYAERGRVALDLGDLEVGDAEAPLEVSPAAAIGLEVSHQVGCSGYVVDHGVRHADRPGRFVLGVEWDDRSYH